MFEDATQFEAEVRGDPAQGDLHATEPDCFVDEVVVGVPKFARSQGKQAAIVALREEDSRFFADVTRKRARVRTEGGEDRVEGAVDVAAIAVPLMELRLEQVGVGEHSEERQEREGDEARRDRIGNFVDEIDEDAMGRTVKFWAKFKSSQRVKEAALGDLAGCDPDGRVESPVGDAGQAREGADDFVEVREAGAERVEGVLRGAVFGLREARAGAVIGENGLQIALEKVGATAPFEEPLGERKDAVGRLGDALLSLAEVLGDDGGTLGRAAVVARISKANQAFEKGLKLKKVVEAFGGERRYPALAGDGACGIEGARVVEEALKGGTSSGIYRGFDHGAKLA